MSTYENISTLTMLANEDLRDSVYSTLKLVSDSGIARVAKTTAVTDAAVLVLIDSISSKAPTTIGLPVATAQLQGKITLKAAVAITAGQLILPSGTTGKEGQVYGVSGINNIPANSMAVGVALEDASAGANVYTLVVPLTSAASS